MKVSGSNLIYARQADGSWRTAMPIPYYGMFSVACPECGRSCFGWGTNAQLDKYEAHWLAYHDRTRPSTWGGVTT